MIKFGPSGNSIAFLNAGYSKSEQSAAWVSKMGLDCFEYSFGNGVRMSDEKAKSIKKAFLDNNVEISVHAPYYVNFSNPDDGAAEKSYNYILESAKKLKLMGGKRLVFHTACQGKADREEAVSLAEKRLNILRDKIYFYGLNDLMFCPETMGKLGQIGSVEEIIRFCKIDKIFVPCIDFGHVNARTQGALKTSEDFLNLLQFMIKEIGIEKMQNFHSHFSKIQYSAKGEVRHLTFEDKIYGPSFEPLSEALHKLNLTPYIVSESAGTQDIDALTMKKIFYNN